MTEPSYLPSDNPRAPRPEHPFRHCLPVQIRFTDIDLLGHVNNNVYLTLFDLAKIEYFGEVLGQRVTAPDLCMVIVNINCDFLSPSFIGDDLVVWTQVTAVSERSIRLEQRIVDRNTSITKCICHTVMAGYDPDTLSGAPIKPKLVEAFERFENRKLLKNV